MIKTIALHLADDPRCEARQSVALALAKRHGAAVVGVCPIAPPIMVSYGEATVAAEIIEAQRRQAMESAAALESAFRAAAAAQKVEADWALEEGDAADILVRRAGLADLLVISQAQEGSPGVVDDVVVSAPTPTLLIPYAGDFAEIGRRALVAWNGSREAARAMRDAAPLLAKAESTTLVAVGLAEERQAELQAACAFLARHGVKADARSLPGTDIDVGDVLLNAVSDLEADLLVMGAYGHSRLRELVLGGATRQVLRSMTVPVLMSR